LRQVNDTYKGNFFFIRDKLDSKDEQEVSDLEFDKDEGIDDNNRATFNLKKHAQEIEDVEEYSLIK